MKNILIYIDDKLKLETFVKCISKELSIHSNIQHLTILKTYLITGIDSKNAVIENDRVKLQSMKDIESFELQISKFISDKIKMTKNVKMGSAINVIPSYVLNNKFDLLMMSKADPELVELLNSKETCRCRIQQIN